MTSHDYNPSRSHAPGARPADPADVTQRAAAVTRHTESTSQTQRSASPGRDMTGSSARLRRMQCSPAALRRPALRQQKGSARPRSRTAAQGHGEAPERPASRPATNPGRPQTLSQILHLILHSALVYGVARVWSNGTIGNRSAVEALRWQHADRLDAGLIPGAIILRPSRHGQIGVHQNLRMTIPAVARRSQGIKTGDFVLLAAAPAHKLLIILTMHAVDELMMAVDAELSGASPAVAASASAIVSAAVGRIKR